MDPKNPFAYLTSNFIIFWGKARVPALKHYKSAQKHLLKCKQYVKDDSLYWRSVALHVNLPTPLAKLAK